MQRGFWRRFRYRVRGRLHRGQKHLSREAPLPGSLLGETWTAILKNQFERLRDGDRFWYRSYLSPFLVRLVEQQTLTRIIRRNTEIGSELQSNPFRVGPVTVDESQNSYWGQITDATDSSPGGAPP
jgi:hypothetical protein